MNIFSNILHRHKMSIKEKSNVIQRDSFGYPLRLCIMECKGCGYTEQVWLDTNEKEDDIELKWKQLTK